MKKLIILFSVAIALVACAKVESEKQEVSPSTLVTFNVKVASMDTKAAAKSAWADGDVIYLVFKGITAKYLTLTYDSGSSSWTPSPAFVAGDFSGLGEYSFTAVHFPIAVTPAMSAGALSFTVGGKPVYTYYMQQEGAAYTFDGREVSVTINLKKADDYVQFHVPGITSSIANYSFAVNDVKPVACSSINASTGAIVETEKNVGAAFGGFLDADGAVFSAKLTKSGTEQDYTFLLTSTTNVYSFTKLRTLYAGTFYKFKETSDDLWTTKKATESMTSVDLGLPSGLKWATCNLGAASETAFGKFYSWGEITGYSLLDYDSFDGFSYCDAEFSNGRVFAWSEYLRLSKGNNNELTKYCKNSEYGYEGFTDNKTRLEAIDDAATNSLGTAWRIPTPDEWNELYNGCTWTWEVNYSESSINGILGISKYNGKTIFLPAAGNGDYYIPGGGTEYDSRLDGPGSLGDYWASTCYKTSESDYADKAYSFDFGLSGSTVTAQPFNCFMARKGGLSVRAILE